MTNQDFAADEFCDGTVAARTGRPFDEWTSKPWQIGWTFQKRRDALRQLGAENYRCVALVLETIGLLCNLLKNHSPAAVELGRAIALRALDGDPVDRDAHPETQDAVEISA